MPWVARRTFSKVKSRAMMSRQPEVPNLMEAINQNFKFWLLDSPTKDALVPMPFCFFSFIPPKNPLFLCFFFFFFFFLIVFSKNQKPPHIFFFTPPLPPLLGAK